MNFFKRLLRRILITLGLKEETFPNSSGGGSSRTGDGREEVGDDSDRRIDG